METDLTLRPITAPGELDLFYRLPYALNDELADDLAAGRRRPEWMWVALRGDRLVARMSWWCPRPAQRPAVPGRLRPATTRLPTAWTPGYGC